MASRIIAVVLIGFSVFQLKCFGLTNTEYDQVKSDLLTAHEAHLESLKVTPRIGVSFLPASKELRSSVGLLAEIDQGNIAYGLDLKFGQNSSNTLSSGRLNMTTIYARYSKPLAWNTSLGVGAGYSFVLKAVDDAITTPLQLAGTEYYREGVKSGLVLFAGLSYPVPKLPNWKMRLDYRYHKAKWEATFVNGKLDGTVNFSNIQVTIAYTLDRILLP